MIEKLLCIKKDRNIFLYKLSYNKEQIENFISDLKDKYIYRKIDVIETALYKGVPLTMREYDTTSNCTVDEDFTILDEKTVSKNTKSAKIRINVRFDSIVSKSIEETFINEDILLNMTSLFKLLNHILKIDNKFKFNEILDVNNKKKKKWNDKSRVILNDSEYYSNIRILNETLNVDDIELNSREKKNAENIYNEIKEKINELISFEQVGMFPIPYENDRLYEIFEIFGERNKSFEYYFGSLERDNVRYNINGGIFINNISNIILEKYKPNEEKTHNKERYIELKKISS